MIKVRIIWTFLFAFILFSCEKAELPIPGHNSGNITTSTSNMGTDYRYQLYYNLETNQIVSQVIKTSWDLGFETSESGYRIILNSSKAMFAFNTGETDFENVIDTSGFMANRVWDDPTGNMDLTAIGDWRSNNSVYILDRGYDENGEKIGFARFQVQSVSEHSYTLRYSDLDGSNDNTVTISKNEDCNFSYLSMSTNLQVIVEPPKDEWDLVFTQYIESLNTPYLVTGALLNRYNTSAVMDSTVSFESINYETAISKSLSTDINTLGYAWKKYDYDAGSFIIYPHMNYIINDQKGYYYKLHFIDFYDQNGNKGNPTWEYQKL